MSSYADDFEQLESEINDEQAQAQVGQQQAAEQEQAAQSEATAALIHELAFTGHALFASNWIIESEQFEAFSAASGKVLDKYFPDGLGVDKYKEELALAGVCFAVYMTNKGRPLKDKTQEVEKGADDAT